MGKGKALRRRAKLVQASTHGNLHKAQKGKASRELPLPSAPSSKDMVDRLPASLRKMMALKAVAENHQSRQKQRLQATASAGGQKQMPEGAGKHQQPQQEPGQQQQGQQQQLSQLQQGKQLQQQKQPQQHRDPAVPIFEQPKKLKQRKKDYLNAKKLKKKKGKKGTEETMHEKERQLVDKVRFGETVHQPLKVHLKRKHWDEAAAQKAEHERCKRVFLSQMNMAQQQQQQAGGKGGGKPAASKVQNEDNSQLRAEVIEAYRSRRKQPAEGRATLGTLKHLVK